MAAARHAWGWLRRNALPIFAGLAIAYMLIPIAIIAVFSFGGDAAGKTHLRAQRRLHHRVLEQRLLAAGVE